MYGFTFLASDEIEDAQVVPIYKAPKSSVNKSLLNKIKKVRNKSFGSDLLQKNSYVVRGGVVGAVIFAGAAMYFKKNIFGAVVIGIATGSLVGLGLSKIKIKDTEEE